MRRAENDRTKMGVVTMITAALMGVVMLNPLKKVSIFKAIPNTEARNILKKS
jgi:hypothetical protein